MDINDSNIYDAVALWCTDKQQAMNVYGHISNWDVSNVTNMQELFACLTDFNENLSKWDVSNVTNMFSMFYHATSFNGDISTWNVSNTECMTYMFYGASSFNQDITNWNVQRVHSMHHMFKKVVFCIDISNWDISSLKYGRYEIKKMKKKCIKRKKHILMIQSIWRQKTNHSYEITDIINQFV